MSPCVGCCGLFAELDGPTHPYMLSSPGCWAIYGEVLAREYADYERYFAVHRLTVDAFAAQHPHSLCEQNTRSVGIHLCRLHLSLERGLVATETNAAMIALAAIKSQIVRLPPPESLGLVTVSDVHAATSPDEHCDAVRRWAASVWQAWAPHHAVIREWVDSIFSQ